jgi:hypothetical protein
MSPWSLSPVKILFTWQILYSATSHPRLRSSYFQFVTFIILYYEKNMMPPCVQNNLAKLSCWIIQMIGLELSQKQQRLMIKIEINPVNISTNTCLQNSLTKNKEHCAQFLLIHMNHTLMHACTGCGWISVYKVYHESKCVCKRKSGRLKL